ncbi:MAG: hypothetical protein V1689_07225, partial [Pseudomonadota bacterium]
MAKGVISNLLNKVYEYKKIEGDLSDVKKRIIRLQLSLKTGLSLNKYAEETNDSPEDVKKVINALKNPEFELEGFPFRSF